jgi:antitoxin YefM
MRSTTWSSKKKAVVMLPLREVYQLDETTYLVRSPANAKRLVRAIKELSLGRGKARKLRLG